MRRRQLRRLTDDERELVRLHAAPASDLAVRFALKWRQWRRDELESIALLELTECVIDFDPTRGVKFWTYAWCRIWGELTEELRRAAREHNRTINGRRISLQTDADFQNDGRKYEHGEANRAAATIWNHEPCPDEAGWAETEARAEKILRLIPEHWRPVMRCLYIEGLSGVETARKLGQCEANVSTTRRNALRMLRDEAKRGNPCLN